MIQEPRFAHYPKIKYPKEVQRQIKKVKEVTKLCADEDTEYAMR